MADTLEISADGLRSDPGQPLSKSPEIRNNMYIRTFENILYLANPVFTEKLHDFINM